MSTWFCAEEATGSRRPDCLSSQVQDGRTRIIAYASRGLNKAEKNESNYSMKKLELLALTWAVGDKCRDYLLCGQFMLYTDNNPLTYLMKSVKLSAVEQRIFVHHTSHIIFAYACTFS